MDSEYSDHLVHRLEDPAHAVAPYPTFYEGPRFGVDPSPSLDEGDSAGQPRKERIRYDNDCTLWIGNVDLRISETMLFELFSQIGDIRNVSFPNQQNQHQGEERASRFCFINFLAPDSVPKAIKEMQGTVIFGRKLFLKCRPGSIHALQMEHQSKYRPASAPLQKEGSCRNSTSSNWVSSTGADSTSDIKKFSPIRAPSPEDSNARSNSRHRKVVLVQDKYVHLSASNLNVGNGNYDHYRVGTEVSARRRVVIKPSSGSVIPVININTNQKKIKSVVVTPPTKKTEQAKSEVSVEAAGSSTSTSPAANTSQPFTPAPVREIKPSSDSASQSIPAPAASYSHPPPPNLEENANGQYNSSIEVLQPQQCNANMMRPWRPRMQFQGYQHQSGYNYNIVGMRPVYPHYNKYFRFNGGARHPNSFPRYRSHPHPSAPAIRPYGYEQYDSYGQPNYGYPVAPFRPTFDNYSYPHPPNYENQQHHEHLPQSNIPPTEMNPNYTNVNRERGHESHHSRPAPPAPPKIASRSRTRSRSKSPRRSYYRGETPDDSKFRRMRSRSRTRSSSRESTYRRRSMSRGSRSSSSYSRGYRSSSQRRFDGHRSRNRTRRSRSESYSSCEEIKIRNFRPVRGSGSQARRSTSSSDANDSDRERGKRSSGELSLSENENVNDSTTVSSSNHMVKKKFRKTQKVGSGSNNSPQVTKQGKGRKSRFIRTSVSSYRAEGEYDPSDPGY